MSCWVVKDHQRTAELRERFPAVGLAEVFEELAPDPETRGEAIDTTASPSRVIFSRSPGQQAPDVTGVDGSADRRDGTDGRELPLRRR